MRRPHSGAIDRAMAPDGADIRREMLAEKARRQAPTPPTDQAKRVRQGATTKEEPCR